MAMVHLIQQILPVIDVGSGPSFVAIGDFNDDLGPSCSNSEPNC